MRDLLEDIIVIFCIILLSNNLNTILTYSRLFMKKLLLIAGLFLGATSLSYAGGLSLNIQYDAIKVAHSSQVTFDVSKGSPAGMQSGTSYTLVCQTTANSDTALSLETYTPNGVSFSEVKVNDVQKGSQFLLPVGSKIEMDNVYFTNANYSVFTIHNLDNVTDVTLTCSATPLVSVR